MVLQKKIYKKHNSNCCQIHDHPYKKLINGGSGTRKTSSLFNLIGQQADVHKIFLHAKDPYGAKYQLLFKKREGTGLKYCKDSKAFI